ncbi:hypothetical protein L596_003890 [Steinernema carpocapsae]|uniref:Uncharacterized protein n=1 Tax=Steinernema carpocapsae TaxID=34508 RepID=A0A4U8UVM5_STECR|nr:hypothetical protein L596_003890 [Steinernema carpocapsae]
MLLLARAVKRGKDGGTKGEEGRQHLRRHGQRTTTAKAQAGLSTTLVGTNWWPRHQQPQPLSPQDNCPRSTLHLRAHVGTVHSGSQGDRPSRPNQCLRGRQLKPRNAMY